MDIAKNHEQDKVADSTVVDQEPTDQYLTFYMADEEFGIDILSVQEIRAWEPITEIPNAPDHVLGVMNLRGTVSPIVDLRYIFGIRQLTYTHETVVIIISVPSDFDKHKTKLIGIVVDAVSDVHDLSEKQIQPSPELAQTHESKYVKGLANIENQMVIVLNLTSQLLMDLQA